MGCGSSKSIPKETTVIAEKGRGESSPSRGTGELKQGGKNEKASAGPRSGRAGSPRSNGTSPIAITDLTRPSPPKIQRVAIDHPPCVAVGEYEGAPKPDNEDERQNYLCSLNVLDTPADSRFDDITRLLCTIFKVPIAIVSLVDKERQWFKSIQGLDGVRQTDRRSSFCAWTLLPMHPEVLIVPDALEDERFRTNPLVTNEPHIRFYAGAPLVTEDSRIRLGSLCVIDLKPRQFDAESCNVLANFAEVVVREIEKEKMRLVESARIRSQTNGLLRAMDHFNEGIMLVNMGVPEWEIVFVNEAWTQLTGIDKDNVVCRPMWDIFEPQQRPTKEAFISELKRITSNRECFSEEISLQGTMSRGPELFLANFRPAANATLDDRMQAIGVPSVATWEPGTEDYYFITLQKSTFSQSLDRSQSQQSTSWRSRAAEAKQELQKDVELGPLIGQGAFGKVYRGMWNGAPVAVKIIQHPTDALDPNSGGSDMGTMRGALELMHSVDLHHPNIVQTYKSYQRPMQMGEAVDASILREAAGRSYTETWLVLEFCDKGNLQEAVDHGDFLIRSIINGQQHTQQNMVAIINTAKGDCFSNDFPSQRKHIARGSVWR
eukprot:jgi/Botrbrau1/1213/Bobra.0163s0021.1